MKKYLYLIALSLLQLFSPWSFAQTPTDYCRNPGNGDNIWINKVRVNDWSIQTGDNNGYSLTLFRGISLEAGAAYTLELEPAGLIRTRDTLYWQVWVDRNRDKDFDDADEEVYRGKSLQRQIHRGKFTAPAGLINGESRLRVMLSLNKFETACNAGKNTVETEDHDIEIVSSDKCNPPQSSKISIRDIAWNSAVFEAKGLDVSYYFWEFGDGKHIQKTGGQSQDTFSFKFLSELTQYQVRLSVMCRNGRVSDYSDPVTFKTPAKPCNPLNANLFRAFDLTASSATLVSGTFPDSVYYQFFYRQQGQTAWIESPLLKTPRWPITDLRANTTYEYRALLYCKRDLSSVSPFSEIAKFTTSIEYCSSPLAQSIRSKIQGDSLVLLEFLDPGKLYKTISWRYRKPGSSTWTYLPANQNYIKVENPSDRYEVAAQGLCPAGTLSEWGQHTLTVEACSAPSLADLQIKKVGYKSVEIHYAKTWHPFIHIRFRPLNTGEWQEQIRTDSLIKIEPLTPATRYEVQIQRFCTFREGSEFSASLEFTTADFPCNLPDPVTFQASSVKETSAVLNCAEVANATRYFFYYRKKGEFVWASTVVSKYNRAEISELQPNTVYEYQVGITCSYSDEFVSSPLSQIMQFKTLGGGEVPCSLSSDQVKIADEGPAAVRLSCTLNAPRYFWSYRKKGEVNWPIEGSTLVNTYVFSELSADVNYEFGVRVSCGNGKITDRVILNHTTGCSPVRRQDVSYRAGELFETYFRASNPAFASFSWRYRPKKPDNTGEWVYLISDNGAELLLENLFEPVYEIQVRGWCKVSGKWSDWLESISFTPRQCALPSKLIFYTRVFNDTSLSVLAENSEERWYSTKFTWIYRPTGTEEEWSKPIVTDENLLSLNGLIPGVSYDVKVEVFCIEGYKTTYTQTHTFQMPLICVRPDAKKMLISKITANSAQLNFNYVSAIEQELRYRRRGSQDNYTHQRFANTWELKALSNLAAKTVYELQVRVVCSTKDTLWSQPLYFSTKACNLPYAGEIVIQSISKDAVVAVADFPEFNSADSVFTYQWQYKNKQAKQWKSLADARSKQVTMRTLKLDSIYDVKLVLKCKNNPADSIQFSHSFKVYVDECAQAPEASWLIGTYESTYGNYNVNCTLPPNYYFDLRYWIKNEQGHTALELMHVPSIQCTYQISGVNLYEGQTLYLQHRLRCPSGNIGPWSDTFEFTRKKQLWESISETALRINAADRSLVLSPNPTSGQFNILLPNQTQVNNQTAWLEIYNLAGQRVQSLNMPITSGDVLSLDLSNQKSGMYIVRLKLGSQWFSARLIIGADR